jgi:prepilin-type processing-associated H-X9-DG protein
MYANENKDRFPPVDRKKNNFIFDPILTYPEYLSDARILACPGDPESDPQNDFRLWSNWDHQDCPPGIIHPDCMTDISYCYLGWEIISDEEAEAFFEVHDRLSPDDYYRDIWNPEDGSIMFRRLRNGDGISWADYPHMSEDEFRAMKADLAAAVGSDRDPSKIPLMWEMPYTDSSNFSHTPAGGNVLYMDGNVEYIKFGEKFPMTKTMARLLEERPRILIADCEE